MAHRAHKRHNGIVSSASTLLRAARIAPVGHSPAAWLHRPDTFLHGHRHSSHSANFVAKLEQPSFQWRTGQIVLRRHEHFTQLDPSAPALPTFALSACIAFAATQGEAPEASCRARFTPMSVAFSLHALHTYPLLFRTAGFTHAPASCEHLCNALVHGQRHRTQ